DEISLLRSCYLDRRHLHSFPTRRSSDLEDAIRFRSGSDALDVREQAKLGQIADVLAKVLPCYTALPPEGLSCAEETVGKLESVRSEEHTSELQSRENLVCRLLLEKKKLN